MLSSQEITEIEAEMQAYERKQAAGIEALGVVQRHRGWVSDESLGDVAKLLDMSADELDGVATFYTLIYRRPVGRHVLHVCDSVSCWLMGRDELADRIRERFGLSAGQTSPDERFTVLPIPCLGACDRAPAVMLDGELHTDVTPESLEQLLERCD